MRGRLCRYDSSVLFAQRFGAPYEEAEAALGSFDEVLALRVDQNGLPIVAGYPPTQLGTVTKAQKDPTDVHAESHLALPTRADKDRDGVTGVRFPGFSTRVSVDATSPIPKTSADKDRDRAPSATQSARPAFS